MPTLMSLINDSKLQMIDEFYVEKITFYCFNVLNAQFLK